MKCISCLKRQTQEVVSKIAFALLYGVTFSMLCVNDAFAQEPPTGSVGEVAANVQGSFDAVAMLITGIGYIGGFGMVLVSIFKFKAHKDNPTQIPVGTPIALLMIGAALIFMPQIFSVSGTTLFGSEGEVGGTGGVTEFGNFSSGN